MVLKFKMKDPFFIIFIIYFSLVNPVLEEFYWRILLRLEKFGFLIDIVYSFYHVFVLIFFIKWYYMFPAVVSLITAGIVWRFIHEKYNDDLTIVLTHAAADLSIIFAIYLLFIL